VYTVQMKLITLNVWGGRWGRELEDFFTAYTGVDVFCLLEVHH